MKTLGITRHVEFGSPPQKYSVTFCVGQEFAGRLKVAGPGRDGKRTEHWMQWHSGGKAHRPGNIAMTEQAVVRFLELENHAPSDAAIEEGNHELMIAGRLPAKVRRFDCHERQLPVSDRAEVG